jgi:hypothetical protein
VIELSRRARALFSAAFVAGQAALVLTAGLRADRAFGFRMFGESSTMVIHLSRDLGPEGAPALVPITAGQWEAASADGARRLVRWTDRVKDPSLAIFDRTIAASYGIEAQLARLQAALDDVATHSPNDVETRALVADVTVTRNGRAPYVVRLVSVRR